MITSPLAGENPYGVNINFDASFDAVKTEIGKLGGADYALVEENCLTLLREKSKDIRLLAFLSYVYLREERWEAFADVFQGLVALAEKDYDRLFPERPNAKQNAFKWLAEQRYTDTVAEKKPASEDDHPHMQRLVAALARLKAVLEPKFPEGSPFPSALSSAAAAWEKATKPKPKEEKPVQAAAAAETPKQVQDNVRKAALFLIEQEPLKPMGYRLLRAVRWELLEKAPPVQDGKTPLPGPNPQQRTYFQGLLAQKDWATALKAAENAFASGANHLWLDLQRISATACKELGDTHKAVREAILFDTALLVKRIPEIAGLLYADGSAMCDEATKSWIGAEVKPVLSSGGPAVAQQAGEAESPLAQEQQKVMALAAAGQIEAAVELLQEAMLTSKSERDNFRRSIQIGDLLLKGKQPDIALSFLEALGEKIEEYHLDKWDPDLTIEAWTAQYNTYKAAKSGKPQNIMAAMNEKQAMLLSRISRINPKKALSLNK